MRPDHIRSALSDGPPLRARPFTMWMAVAALVSGFAVLSAGVVLANTPFAAVATPDPTVESLSVRQADLSAGDDGVLNDHASRIRLFAERLRAYQLVERLLHRAPVTARLGGGIKPGRTPLECLTQAVYYEARGEPREGQVAVAQVVLNRERAAGYPKTVCGVVFQGASRAGCQFSFACEGNRQAGPIDRTAWSRAETVAAQVLNGEVVNNSTATHYHTTQVFPKWDAAMTKLEQIGRHLFFGASPNATSPQT